MINYGETGDDKSKPNAVGSPKSHVSRAYTIAHSNEFPRFPNLITNTTHKIQHRTHQQSTAKSTTRTSDDLSVSTTPPQSPRDTSPMNEMSGSALATSTTAQVKPMADTSSASAANVPTAIPLSAQKLDLTEGTDELSDEIIDEITGPERMDLNLIDLQTSLDASIKENAEKERQLKDLEQKCDQLQIKVDNGNADSKIRKALITELNTQIQSLNGKLSTSKDTIKELSEQVAPQKQSIEANVSTVNALDVKLAETETQKSDNGPLIDTLNSAVSKQIGELKDLTNANTDLNAKLEIEYASLKYEQAASKEKYEQLSNEKALLQQSREALQSSSSDSNSEIRRQSSITQSGSYRRNLRKKATYAIT